MARDRLAFIGTPSARATISSVRPALIRDAQSGYPVAIGAIIQGQEVDLSVDERSCLLLLAAIAHYCSNRPDWWGHLEPKPRTQAHHRVRLLRCFLRR